VSQFETFDGIPFRFPPSFQRKPESSLSNNSGVAGRSGFVRYAGYLFSTGFQRSLE
jgi:hypothetical protein